MLKPINQPINVTKGFSYSVQENKSTSHFEQYRKAVIVLRHVPKKGPRKTVNLVQS